MDSRSQIGQDIEEESGSSMDSVSPPTELQDIIPLTKPDRVEEGPGLELIPSQPEERSSLEGSSTPGRSASTSGVQYVDQRTIMINTNGKGTEQAVATVQQDLKFIHDAAALEFTKLHQQMGSTVAQGQQAGEEAARARGEAAIAMQTAENLHKAVTNTQSRVDYVAIGLQDEFNRQLQEMEKKIAERYKNKQAEEQAKMLQAELDLQK